MHRRDFLGLIGGAASLSSAARAAQAPPTAKPDVTLTIAPVDLEIAPGRIVKTVGYNGSVPGPLIRLREGRSATIEVRNELSSAEIVHWHGLFVPSEVDGSAEEGTPEVPPHGSQRYTFTPRPSGTRWYHTHMMAGRNLKRGIYSGQFGIFYIEPKQDPASYDAEVFLALHGWDPYLGTMGADEGMLEVTYKAYTINSRAFGHAEPIRVKENQRVMFRIVNSSATESHRLALSGHKFNVLALDGNPVPTPREVEVLDLAPGERADATVTMNQPGVWVLGDLDDSIRKEGLGIVVEYANKTGPPVWTPPTQQKWDYLVFGRDPVDPTPEAEVIPLVFKRSFAGNRWVDHWTINGKSYPKTDPIRVRANRRYRLHFDNQSTDPHPVHLHRHSFELTNYTGRPTSGIFKDVVVVPANRQVDVDFVADHPGLSLFHCHQQLHMDFGFMTMLEYVA